MRLAGPAIAVCTSGTVSLEGGPALARGHAVYVEGEQWLGLRGDGVVFIASPAEA